MKLFLANHTAINKEGTHVRRASLFFTRVPRITARAKVTMLILWHHMGHCLLWAVRSPATMNINFIAILFSSNH